MKNYQDAQSIVYGWVHTYWMDIQNQKMIANDMKNSIKIRNKAFKQAEKLQHIYVAVNMILNDLEKNKEVAK